MTYNSRSKLNLEEKLADVKEYHNKLVMMTGHTKLGKTVLTRKVFPKDKTVWLDGGSVSSEEGLWLEIVRQLGIYIDETVSKSKNKKTQGEIKGEAKGQLMLAFELGGKASVSQAIKEGESKTQSRKGDPKTSAIKYLKESKTPLIIDDFHYIDRNQQAKLVRVVKSLIFEGLPVVFIAIPHRRFDAMKVEREMTGRIDNITVPHWEIEELIEIPKSGFKALNVDVTLKVAKKLAEESIGSPHLMQDFCRELCNTNDIEETLDDKIVIDSIDDQIFRHVAQNTGRVIFDKLSRGPRARKDRLQRELRNGELTDIYGLTLHALADLKPGLDKIEYEAIRTAIKRVSAQSPPQGNEITRVLDRMSEIATSDESSTPVIEWDKEEGVLYVTDPFFAFYLRWGKMD